MWQVPGLTLQPKGISEKHSANKDPADLGTDGPTALCEQEKGQTSSREVLWAWEDVMWKRTFRIAWTEGLREMEATINFLRVETIPEILVPAIPHKYLLYDWVNSI